MRKQALSKKNSTPYSVSYFELTASANLAIESRCPVGLTSNASPSTTTGSSALSVVIATQVGRRRARGGHIRAPARRRDPSERNRFALLLVAAGAVAVLLALGGTVRSVKVLPWRFFYWYVPGFGGLRVTARLAVLGLLAGAVMATTRLRPNALCPWAITAAADSYAYPLPQ